MAKPLSRDECLDARFSDLSGYWLSIRCAGCGAATFYPCKLMARQRGPALRVKEVLGRLRCKQCGSRDAAVGMTDDPAAGGRATGVAWQVDLVP